MISLCQAFVVFSDARSTNTKKKRQEKASIWAKMGYNFWRTIVDVPQKNGQKMAKFFFRDFAKNAKSRKQFISGFLVC